MPAIPTVGGVAYFWAGGRQLRVRGDFKVEPNNFQWEGAAGQDGVHGRKRVPVIPTVAANISDDGTLSLQDLVAVVDQTVTVELDNGIYQQTWYSGLAQLDTGEGQIGARSEALTACRSRFRPVIEADQAARPRRVGEPGVTRTTL
jgi:hypothetical protein